MKRIDFLKQLIAGSALLFLPKQETAKQVNEIRLSSPYIAGFQHYHGSEIEALLRVNDMLSLKREPINPHDCYAVEVFWNDVKLGYPPREENKVIARMMDQGITVKAKIIKIKPEEHPYRRIKAEVFYWS
ncbi:MAG: HIRAN domain-containing protein [Prolixibacteraceae bacterium]|nr:HIRAN domain-containing protein [Prolixibacteraceae bacterium]